MHESFEAHGYHEIQATIAGELRTFRIYPHQTKAFRRWDAKIIWDRFPHHIDVLTIHGIQDRQIPV